MSFENGVRRVFMTGVTPISLVDNTSGFNVACNISFDPHFATLCGLTKENIVDTLAMIFPLAEDERVRQHHLDVLKSNFSGYHFCRSVPVQSVFNTETCLEYFSVCINDIPGHYIQLINL